MARGGSTARGSNARRAQTIPPLRRVGVAVLAVASLSVFATPNVSAQSAVPLVGTFRITGGSCDPVTGTIKGSWFRLIFPGGNVHTGFFFQNSTSPCFNKSYTTISPGTQGGLVTGAFQPRPRRAFATNGDARAKAIIEPVPFAAIDLSLSTQRRDPQTNRTVQAPSIAALGGKLTGDLQALSVSWKNVYINQGSPKPGGARPGLTVAVAGNYNVRTHLFALSWTSQIVGGPFTGFIGDWYLSGRFVPSR